MEAKEIQISYSPVHHAQIKSSMDIFNYLKTVWDSENMKIFEEFKVIYLNQSNKVLGVRTISQGGIASTVVDLRIILSIALKSLATSIILSHNHPSGNLVPSNPDKVLTAKIKKACELLDIGLLDHVIISSDSYYSFADNGYL